MYSEEQDIFPTFDGQSATHEAMNRMALYGAKPALDEPDTRPMPSKEQAQEILDQLFVSMVDLFDGTSLEDDSTDILWSMVNVFQRKIEKLEKGFDQLSFEIRRSLKEQDGSEIKSYELESLQERGQATSQARDYFEGLRSYAADLYFINTAQPWQPARGSRPAHGALTAAVLDGRDFLQAQERKKVMDHAPEGPKVIVAGGQDFDEYQIIYKALDGAYAKHKDMILIHGGAQKGVDLIAAKWAEAKKVHQIICKPDWNKYGKKRAGFMRNDSMLSLNPIGLLAFPGSGLTGNLIDKAKAKGIPTKVYS